MALAEWGCDENRQRARAWVGTAHVLTSTQDGAVEQKEQKEVKYIVPNFYPLNDILWFHSHKEISRNDSLIHLQLALNKVLSKQKIRIKR